MTAKNRVLVIEDDPLSRDMLVNLISRDWRTHVASKVDSLSEDKLVSILNDEAKKVDTVIIDTEMPRRPDFPIIVFENITQLETPPKVIFLCTVPRARFWNNVLIDYPFFGGYLVKHEIQYSISTAISLVDEGYIVITDTVDEMDFPINYRERQVMLLDGTKLLTGFTPREIDVIRLGILFNLSHRDIEDELFISRDWISENLSSIYKKLNLLELISGEEPLESFFSHEAIITRVEKILSHFSQNSTRTNLRKTPWLATLAFHMLTLPEIREI